ncbi:hypothetical protein BKA62DRAFT_43197 [Auriculariales sp. MPI-PUGE-AT-0066]|nr:hypothetical protein BKA62DRAFT_43197 [Auriculariales sp. MPI-PUGE-AT-0066]
MFQTVRARSVSGWRLILIVCRHCHCQTLSFSRFTLTSLFIAGARVLSLPSPSSFSRGISHVFSLFHLNQDVVQVLVLLCKATRCPSIPLSIDHIVYVRRRVSLITPHTWFIWRTLADTSYSPDWQISSAQHQFSHPPCRSLDRKRPCPHRTTDPPAHAPRPRTPLARPGLTRRVAAAHPAHAHLR